MKNREAKALELTRRVLTWARSAYVRESTWNDMNWSPPSLFAQDRATLRRFIDECEELFPELKSNDQPTKP